MTTTELLRHRSHTLPWDAETVARQLLSRIDVALELGAGTPQESVSAAWRSLVRDQPGVRRVLDAASSDPASRAARRSLFASVAVAAGLATFDDPAATSVATGERFLAEVDAGSTAVRMPSRFARALRRLWDGGPEPDPYPWAA